MSFIIQDWTTSSSNTLQVMPLGLTHLMKMPSSLPCSYLKFKAIPNN